MQQPHSLKGYAGRKKQKETKNHKHTSEKKKGVKKTEKGKTAQESQVVITVKRVKKREKKTTNQPPSNISAYWLQLQESKESLEILELHKTF